MRILVAGDYSQHWRAPAWARALQELGAEIIQYDWRQDYTPNRVLYHLERRYLVGPGLARINRRLLALAGQASPDLVLIYAGQPIYPSTVRALVQRWPTVGYHNDDPFGRWAGRRFWRLYVQSLPAYSAHHVFRELNVEEYGAHGCARVKLLRYFYLPWMHFAVPLSDTERSVLDTDVVFLGGGQPGPRIDYISALVDAGLSVRVYGDAMNWRRFLPARVYRRLPSIHPVVGPDYARVVRSAKICLAALSVIQRDDYTLRHFEIPACEGFMLSERSECLLSLFADGREAAYFSGTRELLEKVKYYLGHERERAQIAAAGHTRCLEDGHDVYSRMRQWLADLVGWDLIPSTGLGR